MKLPSKVRSYSSRIRFWWKRFANGMQHNVRKEIVRTQYCQKKTVDSRNRVHRRAHGEHLEVDNTLPYASLKSE